MDLTNVFRSHLDADHMQPEDVKRLFSPPPGFSNCLRPVNQVLIGPRGSGKSIALRWLSYLPQRPDHTKEPPFYGLLLRIGRFQFDHFKQTFMRTEDSRPFLAYLNLYIFSSLLEDLKIHWTSGFELELPRSYRLVISRHDQILAQRPFVDSSNIARISSLVNQIHSEFLKQVEVSDIEPGFLANLTSIQDTLSLLLSFRNLVAVRHAYNSIGLLIDGLDHLEDLGRCLVPLLSKDEPYSDKIVVKAACRELPRYLYANAPISPRVEEGRDYFIVPVGYYDDDANFEKHLESVMTNRFRVYLGAEDAEIPSLSDIIPAQTGALCSGFSDIAKFSAGNILIFLETCAFALAYEQEATGRTSAQLLSVQSQEHGVRLKSESYFYKDLDDQIGELADELRKYLESFAQQLLGEGDSSSSGTLSFYLDTASLAVPTSQEDLLELIAKACEFRFLSIPRATLVPVIRRQKKSLMRAFEMSATLAPLFGLRLTGGNPINLDVQRVSREVALEHNFAAKDQKELFPPQGYVFLSIPGDSWGKSVRSRIVSALGRLRLTSSPAGILDNTPLEVITFREVSQRKTGRYLDNLVEAIRNAQYIILDATGGPTSGVIVEMGIASGHRKPHSICWFADKPLSQSGAIQRFDPQALPEEIRLTDIKTYAASANGREPFYKWFARLVHAPCTARSEMCGFQGSDAQCDCEAIVRNRNLVYIRMQPRNRHLRDLLCGEFRRRNVGIVEPQNFGESLAAHTCRLLRNAVGAVFDVTSSWDSPRGQVQIAGGPPTSAHRYAGKSEEVLPLLEIGYSLATGLSHACIYREALGCIHSPMLPGSRTSFAETDLEGSVSHFVDWFIADKMGGR
jgi:hypothetical protein